MTATVPPGWAALILAGCRTRLTAGLAVSGDPVADLPAPLTPAGGGSSATAPSVTVDTTATALWTCSMSFVDPDGLLRARLAPTGVEVWLTAGIDDGAGGWWDIPMGVYGITGRVVTNTVAAVGPVIALTGQDRSQMIGASKTTELFTVAAGTSLAAATVALICRQVPWLPGRIFLLDDGGATLPATVVDAGADPWATVTAWWATVGLRLWLDRAGNLRGGTAIPVPAPGRSWQPGAGLMGLVDNSDITRSSNGVTVIGNNPSQTPVQATAWDDNPASLTYSAGPFGRRPAAPVTVGTAQSFSDCYRSAVALIPTLCGLSQSWVLDIVPDPSVDPWDVDAVTSPTDGIDAAIRQVSAFTWSPTGGTPMQVTNIPLAIASPLGAAA